MYRILYMCPSQHMLLESEEVLLPVILSHQFKMAYRSQVRHCQVKY